MRQLCFFCFWLLTQVSFAQSALQPVPGLPTKELYDLHVDRKGYLWVAHSLGISRYDGLNFITYSHPSQINLRYTDIVEDRHNRIWCHNFSGQVFYIENGKIQLLESYDYRKENHSPEMVLCGNELLITSYKGLFVCNTENLATRFLPFAQSTATAPVSIAVVKNKAVICNYPEWYVYSGGQLKKAVGSSPLPLPENEFVSLQNAACHDTLFLTANPSGVLYKLLLQNDCLRFLEKQPYHDYINAVSVDGTAWVHARHQSRNLTTGAVIPNFDLNDIVTGKEGNTWYGSRREGLLVNRPSSLWQRTSFQIDKGDYIRCLNANAGYFLTGTEAGTLYQFSTETSKPRWKLELFNGLGSIDIIRYLNNDLFIVGSSTDTYIVNAREKKILATLPIRALGDVDFDGNSFYVATTAGLYVVPYLPSGDKEHWQQQMQKQFSFYNWHRSNASSYLLLPQQTWSVRFDSLRRSVYAATKNGVVQISKSGIQSLTVQGKTLFATAISFKQPRLYISTVNDGLWIVDGQHTAHFTTANTLASNSIIRGKRTEDHIWLFEKNGIQVLDIHTDSILENLDLPKLDGANVLDVAEKGDYGYLTTAEGVYKVPLNATAPKIRPTGYLDEVIVNGRDRVENSGISLSYQQNDLQFYFSSPAFTDPENVSFRYRLQGAESEWQVTAPGERMVRYPALAPGEYAFELYAISNNGLQQAGRIVFPFTIAKPWWRTLWFLLLLNAIAVAIVYLLARNRINQKLRLELMRRNISSDLHDDIGATLSSVNFYLDLARSDKDNDTYLQYIKQNVHQVISNLDDLVWSINPRNDSTEQLVHHMRDYAVPLLKAANMRCQFTYDPKLMNLKMNLETKRNLYLLFKEMVNNVAKHARGQNCFIQLRYQQGKLDLSVTDDGQGFHPEQNKHRNGLFNMQERTRKLKGEFHIQSAVKKGSRVAVTIPV